MNIKTAFWGAVAKWANANGATQVNQQVGLQQTTQRETPQRVEEFTRIKGEVKPFDPLGSENIFNNKEQIDPSVEEEQILSSLVTEKPKKIVKESDLSPLGKELEKALNHFGLVSKGKKLEAMIMIEDYKSFRGENIEGVCKMVDNISVAQFYFSYNKEVTPAEFIRFTKPNSNFEVNVYNSVICDALKIIFIKDGVAKVLVSLARGV